MPSDRIIPVDRFIEFMEHRPRGRFGDAEYRFEQRAARPRSPATLSGVDPTLSVFESELRMVEDISDPNPSPDPD